MLKAYRLLTLIALPLIGLWLLIRTRKGKEDAARGGERWGKSKLPRPAGSLVWVHAASVGEVNSVLPLISKMVELYPSLHVLITSGTVTSAQLLENRLPERCVHQYAPVDHPLAVHAFLDHWKPNLALWAESELWPNLVTEARARGCQLVLLNARMSEKSYSRWAQFRGLIEPMLHSFLAVFPQSARDADRFKMLGAKDVRMLGNLKLDAPPLPCNMALLTALKHLIGERPVWLGASTHPGEEIQLASIHLGLKAHYPNLLTIIVPRHAERGKALASELIGAGLSVARRSAGETPLPYTDIYLADTMGELGLFYRLADIVFIGGSLVPHGGQNPLEPARLDCAILCGPHMENFQDVCDEMITQRALGRVTNAEQLAQAVHALFQDTGRRTWLIQSAHGYIDSRGGVIDKMLTTLKPMLEQLNRPA